MLFSTRALAIILPLVVLVGGCVDVKRPASKRPRPRDTAIDASKIKTRDDIIKIVQYWPQDPWLRDSSSGRCAGFRVPTYFVSGQTQKGAFVPGKIFGWLYALKRDEHGKSTRELAHVWEFDRATAMGYRVRKKSIGGYFYGFMLLWPPELQPAGKSFEIEFGYERLGGTVITSPPRKLRVPLTRGEPEPKEDTRGTAPGGP